MSDRAILIGGVARSGTSLMRDIVGSHPDVAMFPSELPIGSLLSGALARSDAGRPLQPAQVVAALVGHPRMRQAGIALDPAALVAALEAERRITPLSIVACVMRAYARQVGRPRWGVKEPLVEFHAARLLAELPGATVVHMIRDPRDVVTSQRAMWGARAQHVVSTIDAWRRSAALARREALARPRDYVAVRYEDLVADPAPVMRRVCGAADLVFRAEMLDRPARPPGWTISSDPALRDRRDIYSAAVARHRGRLPAADCCYIQLRAGREMDRWGYARPRVALTAGDRMRLAVLLAQEGAWRVAARWRRFQPTGGRTA
jgi:hypothetical protein